jgi:hypothetical protein
LELDSSQVISLVDLVLLNYFVESVKVAYTSAWLDVQSITPLVLLEGELLILIVELDNWVCFV